MRRITMVGLLLAVGCASPVGDGADEELEYDPGPVPEALVVEVGEAGAAGSFTLDGEHVVFGIDQVGEDTFDLFLEVHGLRLTLLVDRASGVMEFDGYAAANGESTQITEEDRAAIERVVAALDTLGEDVEPHVDVLRSIIDHWSEYNEAMPLERQHLFVQERGYTSLCGYCGSYVKFSFDCNHGGWWTDQTTAYGFVYQYGAYSCASGTKWKTSSGTRYCLGSDPNHFSTYEYGYGNCFARCGGGCGSSRRYTRDCGNHDLCVRSNHSISSAYCNDQFASTSDDAIAAPKCSGCG